MLITWRKKEREGRGEREEKKSRSYTEDTEKRSAPRKKERREREGEREKKKRVGVTPRTPRNGVHRGRKREERERRREVGIGVTPRKRMREIIEERTGQKEDFLTGTIIGAAIEVHKTLGPGLLESVYENCLVHELRIHKLNVEQQKEIPISYKNLFFEYGYRADIVVENYVIVEIKSVNDLVSIHGAQLLSYLKLSGYRIGILINFNVTILKDGIRRIRV